MSKPTVHQYGYGDYRAAAAQARRAAGLMTMPGVDFPEYALSPEARYPVAIE